MVVTGCQENKSCSEVLNFLDRLDDRIRCTHKELEINRPTDFDDMLLHGQFCVENESNVLAESEKGML